MMILCLLLKAFQSVEERYPSEELVAFEIEIIEMDSVFKLSQNRDAESYHNIKEKLKEQDIDGQVIAAEMEKRTKELFPQNKK